MNGPREEEEYRFKNVYLQRSKENCPGIRNATGTRAAARLELELGLGCGTPVLRQHRKRDTLTHVRDASASVSLISR